MTRGEQRLFTSISIHSDRVLTIPGAVDRCFPLNPQIRVMSSLLPFITPHFRKFELTRLDLKLRTELGMDCGFFCRLDGIMNEL